MRDGGVPGIVIRLGRGFSKIEVEDGHRTCTACHLANVSLRLGGRSIRWDPQREEILGDAEASNWLERPYRKPWDEVLRLVKS